MKKMIGYCGLDCEACEAYIATVNDDQEKRVEVAKKWSEMYDAPILPEHINCEGCRVEGVKTYYCESLCEIRKCALEKGVETCGGCTELKGCIKIEPVITNVPEALENLKGE